jgi:hypothetical protein
MLNGIRSTEHALSVRTHKGADKEKKFVRKYWIMNTEENFYIYIKK